MNLRSGTLPAVLAAFLAAGTAESHERERAWDCDPVRFADGSSYCIDLVLGGERYRGAEALRFVRSDAGHAQLLAAASGQDDLTPPSRRADAMQLLAQVYPEEARSILIEALAEDSRRLREAAMIGLATVDDAAAVAALVRVAGDRRERNELRQQAVFWLASMDHPDALAYFDRVLGSGS